MHVAGAVRRPGLMRLPPGSRVAEALERAGGPTAARRPHRREPRRPAAGRPADRGAGRRAGAARRSAGAAAARRLGGAAGGPPGAKVHLSTATVEQLDGVDGIGPTLAQRIIEYRDSHGGFRSLAELAQVEGIGEKRLATLREALQP